MPHTQDRIFVKLDGDLKRRALNFLSQRGVQSLRYVTVEASNGTVCLRGEVGSFYEKQLCLNCCQRVAGVLEIIDHLKVALPMPPSFHRV